MDYDSITIDTQTVETNSFHFDGGLLGQLKQFVDGRVDVVISQIVATETLRHLREKTQGAIDALESAHKKAQLYGLKTADDKAFIESPDAQALARTRLTQYFREIGATIVLPDDVPMRDLVRTYVQSAPPFASVGKKKNEFPDAIALLSLEQWAKKHDKRILAVSGDGDWAAFAEKCEHIDVIADLSSALAKLQEATDEAETIVERLLSSIESGKDVALAEQFEDLLSDEVSGASVYAEAESAYYAEGDDVEVMLNRYEFRETGEKFQLQIVQVRRTTIVASVSLRVFVNATATFTLSVYDSIDKDYVSLGSTTAYCEDEEISVNLLITFEGDFNANEIELTKVELTDGLDLIDFGYVEPDYGEPDYEYEEPADSEEAEPDTDVEPADDEPF